MNSLSPKNFLPSALALLCAAVLSTSALAKEIPQLPPGLDTGTETVINPADVIDLLGWAEETKATLEFALRNYETYSTRKQPEYLRRIIFDVITRSGNKPNQLFVRYALARSYVLLSKIRMEAFRSRTEFERDLLLAGIRMALAHYESDVQRLESLRKGENVTPDYALFGGKFATTIVVDLPTRKMTNAGEYDWFKLLLGWLANDLNKSLNRRDYATQIALINTVLATTNPDFNGYDNARSVLKKTLEQIAIGLKTIHLGPATVFTRDFREGSGLGWRDPSGLIWFDKVLDEIYFKDAKTYCKKLGGRLPTQEEFEQLKAYLGGEQGYRPQVLHDLGSKDLLVIEDVSRRPISQLLLRYLRPFFLLLHECSQLFSIYYRRQRHKTLRSLCRAVATMFIR